MILKRPSAGGEKSTRTAIFAAPVSPRLPGTIEWAAGKLKMASWRATAMLSYSSR